MRDIGDELYQVPPERFVAARNEAVAEARRAGDREAGTELAKLRRPTAAGWLVNLLALRRPHRIDELMALAEELRSAQRTLSGAQIRELSTRRRQMLDGLAADMRALAAEAGRPAEPAQVDEATETLSAALADEAAAETVRSGRVLRGIRYAGFGESPAADAVVVPFRKPERPEPAPAKHAPAKRAAAPAEPAAPTKPAPTKHAARAEPAAAPRGAASARGATAGSPTRAARPEPTKAEKAAQAERIKQVEAARAKVLSAENGADDALASERDALGRLSALTEEFNELEKRVEEARRVARDASRARRAAEREAVLARRQLASIDRGSPGG